MNQNENDEPTHTPLMARKTNPVIWGAVTGLIAAAIVTLSKLSGQPDSANSLVNNPLSSAAIGFFWGWAAGNLKLWYGKRSGL